MDHRHHPSTAGATAWLVARSEGRGRWLSLLGVAILVGLVTAVVLTALVGARRTETSVDRYRAAVHASDVTYQTDSAEGARTILDAARARPEVAEASMRVLANAFPQDGTPDLAIMADPDGRYGTSIDGVRLLAGRMPAADAADEILLNELAARLTGLRVGDRLTASTWSSADLEALFTSNGFPGFNGPALDLEIVGIGRAPEELTGDVRRTAPFAIASPAFLADHPDLGTWPPAVVVRLRDGYGVDELTRVLAADLIPDEAAIPEDERIEANPTTADEVYLGTARATVRSLAAGLLLFALGAAIAGLIAIAQAVNRQIAGGSVPAETLRALGATRSESAAARALPVVGAAALGVGLGVAGAVLASPLLPTGLAHRAEVDAGIWVSPAILAVGAAVIVGLVAGWAFVAARRRDRPVDTAPRRAATTHLASRSGSDPRLVLGLHLAGARGRSAGSVPMRSALAGVALAVTGVLAAGVIATSLHDLRHDPARWGWTWSSMPDDFGEGESMWLQEQRLIADDRIDAVGELASSDTVLDGRVTKTYAITALKGDLSFMPRSGRLPTGPGEIGLGRRTMHELGLGLGDTVRVIGPDAKAHELTVVGSVVIPPTEEYRLDDGAVLTPASFATLQQGDPLSSVVLTYPAGVEAGALEAELTRDYGLQFGPFTRAQVPGAVLNLSESRSTAVALGLFFVALAAIGLLHALSVSTRRRRGDLALTRALGLRPRDVRDAVLVSGLALTAAGLVVGIPVGLVLGRVVWRALTGQVGVVSDPGVPWQLLLVSIPVALGLALVVAWWPGHAASRRAPAALLRAE